MSACLARRELVTCLPQTPNVVDDARVKRVRLRSRDWDDETGIEREPLADERCRSSEKRDGGWLSGGTARRRIPEPLHCPAEWIGKRSTERHRPQRRVRGSDGAVAAAMCVADVQIHGDIAELPARDRVHCNVHGTGTSSAR